MKLKKMQIAVFDFAEDDCRHTAKTVREFVGRNADVVEYTAMQEFTYAFRGRRDAGDPFDMVFIGIDNMLGVETARNIRGSSRDCPMFIVSEVSDYGIEGFRLYALDYLIKPVSTDRVERAVMRTSYKPRRNYGGARYEEK
jgi:two-component SAPR family response regulator